MKLHEYIEIATKLPYKSPETELSEWTTDQYILESINASLGNEIQTQALLRLAKKYPPIGIVARYYIQKYIAVCSKNPQSFCELEPML